MAKRMIHLWLFDLCNEMVATACDELAHVAQTHRERQFVTCRKCRRYKPPMTVDELICTKERAQGFWAQLSGFACKWELALMDRYHRLDPRDCLQAIKMYGSTDGLLSLLECRNTHLPGDCPLCGVDVGEIT